MRPMILTKQLELQDTNPVVSTTTPRSNLAKELEKYNRPTTDISTNQPQKVQSPVTANCGSAACDSNPKPSRPRDNAPERPNILSRRPRFKPRYSYVPSSPVSLNMGMPPLSVSTTNSVSLSSGSCNGNSNSSGGSSQMVGFQSQASSHTQVLNQDQTPVTGAQILAPMNMLSSPLVMQGGFGGTTLNIPQPLAKMLSNNSSIMNITSINAASPLMADSSSGVGSYNG